MVHSVSVGASWPGYYSRCLRAWTPNVWRARGPYRCCAFERECISRALFAGGTQLFAHRAALRSLKPIFSEIRGDAFPPEPHRLHCSEQHGCVRPLFFWPGVAGPLDFA